MKNPDESESTIELSEALEQFKEVLLAFNDSLVKVSLTVRDLLLDWLGSNPEIEAYLAEIDHDE